MEHIFGNMQEKLRAVTDLKTLGIDNDQALDIVFETIEENERTQFLQHLFTIAFMYGQMHEKAKNSRNYIVNDKEAMLICINECTKILKG